MYRILLTTVLLLCCPGLSYSQPAILFNEVRHDFGRVAPQDKMAYVFEFANTGDEPLVIEKLTSS